MTTRNAIELGVRTRIFQLCRTLSRRKDSNIGALIIGIGFWGPLYYVMKEPPKKVCVIISAPILYCRQQQCLSGDLGGILEDLSWLCCLVVGPWVALVPFWRIFRLCVEKTRQSIWSLQSEAIKAMK